MPPEDPLIGRHLANFRIERVIGRGGMATVYYGWDVKLDRPVAVKVIDARYRGDPSYAQRFVNEARAVAKLVHKNILQIYYADDEDGLYYFAMEYIQGLNLEQLLDQYMEEEKLMPQDDVVRIGRAVASALDFAHRHHIVHRDVKPSNVMVSEDRRVVLADFGLAMDVVKGTMGEVFGSPHYISPEQARNSANAVPQSDLYSLGILLYEMLTGELPFDDPSPTSLALQHLVQEPPSPRKHNPDLSAETERVVLKGLEKSPEDRFQSGRALMDALEKALSQPEPTAPFLPTTVEDSISPDSRPISQLSVADRVAVALGDRPSDAVYLPEPQGISLPKSTSPEQTLRNPYTWLGAGGCGLLILLGGIFAAALGFIYFNRGASLPASENLLMATATSTATDGSELIPSPTASKAVFTITPESATRTPDTAILASETEVFTETPAATKTPPIATSTPVPNKPPTSTPEGDYFELYYDNTGLYFKNLSGKDRSIYLFAFERLDKDGKVLNRFEGWRWGEIYSNFRTGYCVVLEIINTIDHLDPPECQGRHLVIRTPTSDDTFIFWTTQDNSRQFRVLWEDKEIARCRILKGFCEVYLP